MANSMPLPAPSNQVTSECQDENQTQSEAPLAQSEMQNSTNGYQDFHEQFLNNHIATIEEDCEGENMTSEFSTQRTQTKE